MIEKPKMIAAIAVLSILGLVGLYAYAVNIQPLYVSPSSIGAEHQGMLVETQGAVAGVRGLSSGAVVIELVDMDKPGSVSVLVSEDIVDGGARAVPGDIISSRGIVEMYRGQPQLVPSSAKDVYIVERGEPVKPSPFSLLSNIHLFENIPVEVEGNVVLSWEDEGLMWAVLQLQEDMSVLVMTEEPIDGQSTVQGSVLFNESRGWWYIDSTGTM